MRPGRVLSLINGVNTIATQGSSNGFPTSVPHAPPPFLNPTMTAQACSMSHRQHHCRPPKIKGSYKCSSLRGCLVGKHVKRAPDDPLMLIVTFEGEHCHIQKLVPKPINALVCLLPWDLIWSNLIESLLIIPSIHLVVLLSHVRSEGKSHCRKVWTMPSLIRHGD